MKNAIDQSLSRLQLDDQIRIKIMERIQVLERMERGGAFCETEPVRGRSPFLHIGGRKRSMRVLVAVLLLIFALSALCIAAELPWKFINFFQAVNETSVYDGIELKVTSAAADDDSVMIFYTLRDLEKDRISEDTLVYDYFLSGPTTIGNLRDGYDEKTKTASFFIMGDNGSGLKGQKLTYAIRSLLEEGPEKLYVTQMNVGELLAKQTADLGEPSFREYHALLEDSFWNAQTQEGADLQESFEKEDRADLLQGDRLEIKFPGVDWVTVTNMGYQDGWLHIRVRYDESLEDLNYGYPCLTDSEGSEWDTAILNSPLPDGSEEFILQVADVRDLDGLYLSGFYTNNKTLHLGEWNVTFEVKGVSTKTIPCSIETGTLSVSKAVLSPFGVSIYGKGERTESIHVQLEDGTLLESEGYSCSGDGETGKFECKYKFAEPLVLEEIQSLSIAGEQVDLP
ncbi:MAG: hypothetical protein K0Q48_2140 [Bacillota bacterium]|nr:hypothetical protein [Bacillota bacterium]